MGYPKYGPDTSHEERGIQRMELVYSHKMRERQVFMDELKEYRRENDKRIMREIKESIGPRWYQALSVPQRLALDTLEFSIYQDILEGRPVRTLNVMKALGIYPRPNLMDLMNCVNAGKEDPKAMLAHLFLNTYGHTIDGKRHSYCLNARLMLSGILYLGLNNLIHLLRERFRPDPPKKLKSSKPKPEIEPPLASPYLQKMVAALYLPPERKKNRPAPLPNLDDLNEPFEEDPPLPKPPPPPPPPPPPKKRLPRAYCEKLAGIMRIEPHVSATGLSMKAVARTSHRRVRGSKLCLTEVKKTYGMSGMMQKKTGSRRKKLTAPTTGMWNAQYMINAVYTIHGKTVFVLGNVSILPSIGELIHGGYRMLGGEYINIHCGFRGRPPPPKPDPCDCVKRWTDTVFQYVRRTKCYCGHHYDYGNEGSFLSDELPFFQKPTRHAPLEFNYHTIYDVDPKSLFVNKEFKKLWDTDSVLHEDDGTQKDKKKKKKKRDSNTCLGENPKPEDYLKCALRLMRRVNIAARLPDIQLVPELKEWMRNRIYGPFTDLAKNEMIRKSNTYWQMFTRLATRGYGHVSVPKDDLFAGHTTWIHKQDLNDKFRTFTQKYRMEMYRSHARVTNMMWPSMYQAQFPDKKFREIYFSYLFGRIEDLQIMHPYSSKETVERKFLMASKRYCCLPEGIEPQN